MDPNERREIVKNQVYIIAASAGRLNPYKLNDIVSEYEEFWNQPLQDEAKILGFEDVISLLFNFNDMLEIIEEEKVAEIMDEEEDWGDDIRNPKISPIKLPETVHIIDEIDKTKDYNEEDEEFYYKKFHIEFIGEEESADEDEEDELENYYSNKYFKNIGVVCYQEFEWHQLCYYIYTPDSDRDAQGIYIEKDVLRDRKLGLTDWIRFNTIPGNDGWQKVVEFKKIKPFYPTLQHFHITCHEEYPDFVIERKPANTIKLSVIASIPHDYSRDTYEGKILANVEKFNTMAEIEVFDEDELIQKGYYGKVYLATILKCTEFMRGSDVLWKLLRLQEPVGVYHKPGLIIPDQPVVIETKREKKAKRAQAIVELLPTTLANLLAPDTRSCPLCKIITTGDQPWQAHLSGKQHTKKLILALREKIDVPENLLTTAGLEKMKLALN